MRLIELHSIRRKAKSFRFDFDRYFLNNAIILIKKVVIAVGIIVLAYWKMEESHEEHFSRCHFCRFLIVIP